MAPSWGNIFQVFTAPVTIYDTGQHILLVVAAVGTLHLYQSQQINVINLSGIQDACICADTYLNRDTLLECGDGFCHSSESCEP